MQAGMGSPRVFKGRGSRVRNHLFHLLDRDPVVPAPAHSLRTFSFALNDWLARSDQIDHESPWPATQVIVWMKEAQERARGCAPCPRLSCTVGGSTPSSSLLRCRC